MNKQFWIKKIIGFTVMAVAFVAFISYVVMRLWNGVLVDVTTVKEITYPPAMGILVLAKILSIVDIQIKIVRSAVDQTGKFKCSNEMLNIRYFNVNSQINKYEDAGAKTNSFELPPLKRSITSN